MVYNANAVKNYENAFLNGGDGTRKTGDTLGKDEFLKLMIAQMQNQDPLEPQSDTEFIAQMAQFSSLEQMLNMNNTMQLNQAISLIGGSVQWTDADGNQNVGVVTSARMYNGKAQVMIGETAVDIDKIKVVTNDGTPLYAASSFIGTEISWLDANGDTRTGVVESVKVISNYPLLVVGEALVDVNSIISVESPKENETISKEVAEATKLIGRDITWEDDQGVEYTGEVFGVQSFDGVPYLVIANSDGSYTYVPPSSVTSSGPSKVQKAVDLIGKTVAWTDANGNPHTGYVNSVKFDNNVPYLVIGTTLVGLDQLNQ